MTSSSPVGRPARVVVYGLGGTIAMTRSAGGGVEPALSAAQLIAAVPGLAETGITVEVEDFRAVPGASLTFADIHALGAAIRDRCAAGDVDGVVVTQGTDTIEETAYLLDLLHTPLEPVVVTGAMRNPTLAGADGPANLLAAVQVAASPAARGLGCLVVLADEVHAARRVRKTHTTSAATFQSPNGGPLGVVVEGRFRALNRLTDRAVIPTGRGTAQPRVPLVTVTLGEDGSTVRALAGQADGLVVAAFGVGHVPAELAPVLGDTAAAIPVVLASRTGAGATLAATYGFPGSERDLLDRGLIPAGFLDPLKARILLHTLLAAGAGHDTVVAAFAVAGGSATAATWPYPHPPRS